MGWILLVLFVVAAIAFQMRIAVRRVSGLMRKLQDPAFAAKLEAGDREALRRELAGVTGNDESAPDEHADLLLARWHRARGTRPPAQPGVASPPAGLRFERAGAWPLLAVAAVAALLAFLRLQG